MPLPSIVEWLPIAWPDAQQNARAISTISGLVFETLNISLRLGLVYGLITGFRALVAGWGADCKEASAHRARLVRRAVVFAIVHAYALTILLTLIVSSTRPGDAKSLVFNAGVNAWMFFLLCLPIVGPVTDWLARRHPRVHAEAAQPVWLAFIYLAGFYSLGNWGWHPWPELPGVLAVLLYWAPCLIPNWVRLRVGLAPGRSR